MYKGLNKGIYVLNKEYSGITTYFFEESKVGCIVEYIDLNIDFHEISKLAFLNIIPIGGLYKSDREGTYTCDNFIFTKELSIDYILCMDEGRYLERWIEKIKGKK